MLLSPERPVPARDHADAIARFRRVRAREGERISVPGRSRLYTHGERAPLAVVLLHGFTTAPEQWVRFAAQLHERGANVVIPRFPGHGYLDRRTRAIASVRRDDLIVVANEAIDIAQGLSERVVVAGLSVAATVAVRIALDRGDVARTVGIVPLFGIKHLGSRANALLVRACESLPSAFLPWDPTGGHGQIPAYGYPKFSTRLLAATLRIAQTVMRRAQAGHVPRSDVVLMLNAREPACNNDLTRTLQTRWNAIRAGISSLVTLDDLPANHDIIDPTNASARIDLVYPYLQRLIEAPPKDKREA